MTHNDRARSRRARYHLRYQIHPYTHQRTETVAEAEALAKACQDLEITEVVLLLGAEEVFDRHLSGTSEDRWFETAADVKGVLDASGIAASLNPWVTVGHADRGRRGQLERLGFTPMVSPAGEAAAAQASFACPRWREWVVGHYGRFAELGFRILWLEDDFRYHNHSPLTWGGGFEQLMLDRLGELAGETSISREAAVEAMTRPGDAHPWRALMQSVWRTAQLEVAELLAAEVARRSEGRSALGLMSSRIDMHAAEGREWDALFRKLMVEGRAAHRPHFAWYSDTAADVIPGQLWLLEAQRALRPEQVSSEPEIENWPYTSWTKSDVQTWSEMTTAQFAGSDALLINAYPNHERQVIERYPRIGEMLRRSRPALDWIAERYPRDFESCGVGLPFRADAAAGVHTHGGGLADLAVDASPAAEFLMRHGVPVTSCPAPVQAVFGQLARAFSDDEVRALLGAGLLLDGVAAEILCGRGFGPHIGVDVLDLVEREADFASGPYVGERVTDPALVAELDVEHTVFSLNMQPALARLEPLAGAEVWTDVHTANGDRWGAGRTAYRNELGGRVAVLAATDPAGLPGSDEGRRLLHRTIRFLEGESPTLPLIRGGPKLIPQLTRAEGRVRLAIANASADTARPTVDFATQLPAWPQASLLAPLAVPADVATAFEGRSLRLDAELEHRGWLVLEWLPQPPVRRQL